MMTVNSFSKDLQRAGSSNKKKTRTFSFIFIFISEQQVRRDSLTLIPCQFCQAQQFTDVIEEHQVRNRDLRVFN